jgi:dual specificity MAP kinase phosphatase
VLVHCMTGTSRGASVVIGYLMHSRRWRLRQSYEWVVQRHPETKLQPQASKQLQQLDSELFPHDSPQPSAPSGAFAPLSQELPQIGPFGTPLQKADDSGSSVPAEQPFPMFRSAHDNFSFGASPSSQQPKERSERAGDPRERMQS